jgi:hypothetical protein
VEITTYRDSDMWLYRVAVAAIAFAATFAAGHFLGRYLHEDDAYGLAHGDREPGAEGRLKIAQQLANGYSDTKGYTELRAELSADEQAGARATPHPIDKNAPFGGIAVGVLAFFLAAENGRVWARKQAAHRQQGR